MTAEKGRDKTKLSELGTRRLPRTVRALYMGAAVQNSGAGRLTEGSQIIAAVGDAVFRLRLKPPVSLFISAK